MGSGSWRAMGVGIGVALALCAAPRAARANDPPAPRRAEALTRDEALALGVERNLSLLVEGAERDRQAIAADAAGLPYVPTLYARVDASSAPLLPGETRRQAAAWTGGLRWSTTVGTLVDAYAEGEAASLGGQGGDSQRATVGIEITQALLRGRGQVGAARSVLEARLDADVERERFRGRLNDLLVDVEAAYWDLAFAQADIQIKTRSRERARQQFEDTQENIRRGLLAEPEIYIVEENLVFFDQQLVSARERLAIVQRRLVALLVLDPDSPVVAADPLTLPDLALPDPTAAANAARQRHPDAAAQRALLQRARVGVDAEANQRLVRLDASGALRLHGVGGPLAEAWQGAVTADRPEIALGLALEVPLDYDPNDARLQRATLAEDSAQLTLADVEQRVDLGVRDRLTELDSQLQRHALAVRRQELAQRKLEAAQDRYRNGISTLDEVVRFQRDLDTANIALQQLLVDLRVTWSRLLRAQGTLHDALGLEVR